MLRRGECAGDFRVVRTVHHGSLSQVVQARSHQGDFVALKIWEPDQRSVADGESHRLARAASPAVPKVVGQGEFGDYPFLALEWRKGVDVRLAATELRRAGDAAHLVGVATGVVRAFAALHQRAVVHGQVHPRHVLVDAEHRVSLVDFSHSALPVGHLSDPSAMGRWLRGEPREAPTFADEQYSVAALVFLLLMGAAPFGAIRARQELAQHVRSDCAPTLSGEFGLPVINAVRRALSIEAHDRFASLDAFADALAAGAPRIGSVVPPTADPLAADTDWFLEQAVPGPPQRNPITSAPTCSVNYGAAGVAYALLRIARARSHEPLLDAAARWLAVAEREQDSPVAFYAANLEAAVLGPVSPYHTGSGIAVVNARLAAARGDVPAHRRSLSTYLELTMARSDNPDLTLGRSSVVVGACHAMIGADPTWPEVVRLTTRVCDLLDGVWHDVGSRSLEYLGVAHGWAGVLYASLLWSRATRWEPPPQFGTRLRELAALAEPVGRGVCWPVFAIPGRREEYWSGWCNGQAGHVMLWTLAYDVLGDERWRRLAVDSAWCVADSPIGVSSLCCGAAGEIYALLSVHRCTGDESWLRRAMSRAGDAAEHAAPADDAPTPLSLYKGRVGLAVLGADLEHPAASAMPLFEVEATP